MKNFKRISSLMLEFGLRVLDSYTKIFSDLVHLPGLLAQILRSESLQRQPVDKRLKRLDEARTALSETLGAIDELSEETERVKRKHQEMLDELDRTLRSKESAEVKLKSVQNLLAVDQNTLRDVVAPKATLGQLSFGFLLGVVASVVATLITPFLTGIWQAVAAWHSV